ncbi:hypothetical protein [Haliea sp. E17]|uniref:hypothetical protein n=1 Tax=Haliea sp. E17 TaxID=3401576 RepID=UPI003AAC0236
MQSFIRIVEIWTPDAAGERLELKAGAYGNLSAFSRHSENLTFAPGQGLPGLAWQAGMPIVMRDLNRADFLRAGPAGEAGLTAGIAMPIFQGTALRAVLVFLCGNHGHSDGAIEIWKDDELSGQSFIDGYYGNLRHFERQSRSIKFPMGWGLPGMVWKTAEPQVVDVGNTNAFLRSQAALEAGISTGIGIPLNSNRNVDDIGFVVTFLSVRANPIARSFEVWRVTDNGGALFFTVGFDDSRSGITASRDCSRRLLSGEGTVGAALQSGMPVIEQRALEHEGTELLNQLAIPVFYQEELRSVVCFRF